MPKDSGYWIILVAGGHAAGKKTVCKDIAKTLNDIAGHDLPISVSYVDMKNYIDRTLSGPSAVNFDQLNRDLIDNTKFSSNSNGRMENILLVGGLYALYDKSLRDKAIMKVFVDCDADTRLSRWILRDVKEQGQDLETILNEYLTVGRPEMNELVYPTKQFADVILPGGAEESGISLIATGVYDRIREDMLIESHHHESDASNLTLTLAPMSNDGLARTSINLRQEAIFDQDQMFYDLS